MEDSKFGDFEEVKDENAPQGSDMADAPSRVRLPRKGEFIGVILQRLGGNRMEVKSTDGKIRNCRVPGKFKRSMWLRPRDIVLITPWEYDDTKADVIYKYPENAVNQLKNRGVLNLLKQEF